MNIAIIGAGLAGVASAYFLSKGAQIHLFDPTGIGSGASGISAGLLHPFPGRLALLSWMGKEGMQAASELFEIAGVKGTKGFLRLATTASQQSDFSRRAKEDESLSWWEKEQVKEIFPCAMPVPGLWIEEALALDTKLYLQALWKKCEERGAVWIEQAVDRLEALERYDAVIIANGPKVLDFPKCSSLELKLTKGHVLVCKASDPFPFSLGSHGHITPVGGYLYLGSTYEPVFSSYEVEKEKGRELKEKIEMFYPRARDFEEVELRAGVRISPQSGYRPCLKQIDPTTWVFTGLGSRGLLYHAYLAKQLASRILMLG